PVLEGHLAAVNAEVATKYEAYTLVKPAKPMPEWSIDEFHDALPAVRDLVVAVLERELVRDDIALEQKLLEQRELLDQKEPPQLDPEEPPQPEPDKSGPMTLLSQDAVASGPDIVLLKALAGDE